MGLIKKITIRLVNGRGLFTSVSNNVTLSGDDTAEVNYTKDVIAGIHDMVIEKVPTE